MDRQELLRKLGLAFLFASCRVSTAKSACGKSCLPVDPRQSVTYIHPYMDGNGRVGRFLMNVMLASGGYPWTVIPVGDRNAYMSALERASVGEDIVPFADFVGGLVRRGLAGEPLPAVPKFS